MTITVVNEIAEYSPTTAALALLKTELAGKIYPVDNATGMALAKFDRRGLVTLRTDLEKKRVEIKAPALAETVAGMQDVIMIPEVQPDGSTHNEEYKKVTDGPETVTIPRFEYEQLLKLSERAEESAKDKAGLESAVESAKKALVAAENALYDFITSPENNVFEALDQALSILEDRMEDVAREACEGSHCMGLDVYTQEFIVDDVHYLATLKCEYNRHDKTYYYLDEREFSYEVIK
jgi:hypothetical protein